MVSENRALFGIIDIIGVESALWLFKDDYTVPGLVSYIDTWEEHRSDLRQLLADLEVHLPIFCQLDIF